MADFYLHFWSTIHNKIKYIQKYKYNLIILIQNKVYAYNCLKLPKVDNLI